MLHADSRRFLPSQQKGVEPPLLENQEQKRPLSLLIDLYDCRSGIETVLEELILMVKDNSVVKGKNFIFIVFSWW